MGSPRDDFALFAGLAYAGLGAVLVIDEGGLWELGDMWYPLPPDAPWLALVQSQETLGFALVVLLVGLLSLGIWAGVPAPLWLRVVVPWLGWLLAVNLLTLRLVGFFGARNPPWWATILLGMFLLVVTKRRLAGLRARRPDA